MTGVIIFRGPGCVAARHRFIRVRECMFPAAYAALGWGGLAVAGGQAPPVGARSRAMGACGNPDRAQARSYTTLGGAPIQRGFGDRHAARHDIETSTVNLAARARHRIRAHLPGHVRDVESRAHISRLPSCPHGIPNYPRAQNLERCGMPCMGPHARPLPWLDSPGGRRSVEGRGKRKIANDPSIARRGSRIPFVATSVPRSRIAQGRGRTSGRAVHRGEPGTCRPGRTRLPLPLLERDMAVGARLRAIHRVVVEGSSTIYPGNIWMYFSRVNY
ncbi:hypothetical protein ABIE56_004473 [Luteibacter sp. 621]